MHDLAHQCPSLWRGPPGCLGLFSCPHSAVRNTDSSRHVSLPGTAQGIYSRLISPALLNSVSYQHSAFSSHKDCPEKPTKLGREHNPLRILRHKTKGQRRTCCWRPDRARQSSMGSDRSMLTHHVPSTQGTVLLLSRTTCSPLLMQAESQIPWGHFCLPHSLSHQG